MAAGPSAPVDGVLQFLDLGVTNLGPQLDLAEQETLWRVMRPTNPAPPGTCQEWKTHQRGIPSPADSGIGDIR